MKQRDPRTDPRPGDVLAYQNWRIVVTRRDGDTVFLSATHADGRVKRETPQGLADFRGWAGAATIQEPENACVILRTVANAVCAACGEPITREVHSGRADAHLCRVLLR